MCDEFCKNKIPSFACGGNPRPEWGKIPQQWGISTLFPIFRLTRSVIGVCIFNTKKFPQTFCLFRIFDSFAMESLTDYPEFERIFKDITNTTFNDHKLGKLPSRGQSFLCLRPSSRAFARGCRGFPKPSQLCYICFDRKTV